MNFMQCARSAILAVRCLWFISTRCVAGCCRVLQGVAECCRVLQGVAVCCSVLQCVAVCCSVLQCVASGLQCVAVSCVSGLADTTCLKFPNVNQSVSKALQEIQLISVSLSFSLYLFLSRSLSRTHTQVLLTLLVAWLSFSVAGLGPSSSGWRRAGGGGERRGKKWDVAHVHVRVHTHATRNSKRIHTVCEGQKHTHHPWGAHHVSNWRVKLFCIYFFSYYLTTAGTARSQIPFLIPVWWNTHNSMCV